VKAVLGIDLGGSTTKIAGLSDKGQLIGTLQIRASDQVTSVYGAVGNFLQTYKLELKDVCKIVITGVGATFITENIYNIPTYKMVEFKAVGLGGCRLAGFDKALVVSMGTGTGFLRVSGIDVKHFGGSGLGGGTLVGLSVGLINENDISRVALLAENGNLNNVDLTIEDISKNTIPNLPPHATAANLGKMKNNPAPADVAIGLLNLIFQVIGMMAVFACEGNPIKDIILTGTLTTLKQAADVFKAVSNLHGLTFTIPEHAVFAGAIGAAAAADGDLNLL
jgi:type II pantothenate kinase